MAANQSVGTWIERRARVAPDRIALVHGETRYSYAELATRIRRLARGLQALGVTGGDRVGWIGENHPACLEGLFAAASLGAALAPINHRLEPDVVAAVLADAEPRVVLRHGSGPFPELPSRTAVVSTGTVTTDDSDYERLIAEYPDRPIDEPVTMDDLCLMPFTSGTTGRPKGIMLTHGSVTWNVINCLSALDVRSDDVTIAAVPFFRTGGTGVNVLPVLFKGGTVIVPERMEADATIQLIERHAVTLGFANPNLLDALARSPLWPHADLSSLRTFMTGGAPVPERLLRVWLDRGVDTLQGYGLSEAGPLVSVLDPPSALRKVGSAGRPALFVDTRIVNESGADVSAREIGELLVRGPNVMAGYWRRPDATHAALDEEGWLRTGDAVREDDEGFLFVIGRVEDAYLSHGQLVHPGVAEHVLLQHPSVAEVCVIGDDSGAIAYVVLASGASTDVETELVALCAEQLAVHARPDTIEFVASLPRNPAGKIMRYRMRARSGQTRPPTRRPAEVS